MMTTKASTEQTSKSRRYVQGATVLAGLFTLVLGIWAFFAPRSFYEQLATFDPYNRHLIHDIGAFQLAIAAALLAAVRWRDTPAVVLSAATVGAVFHWVSHLLDRRLGGRESDLWVLGVFALVLLATLILHLRHRSAGTEPDGPH